VIVVIVSFQLVLVEEFGFADKECNMFPARFHHMREVLIVLTNLDDAIGVWFVAGFEPEGDLFESKLTLTQVSVSLSKAHRTPQM